MTVFLIVCTSRITPQTMTAHYDARHRDIVSYLDDDDVAPFYQLYSQLHTASMHLNIY